MHISVKVQCPCRAAANSLQPWIIHCIFLFIMLGMAPCPQAPQPVY